MHTNEIKVSMAMHVLVEHACFVENASKNGHISHFYVHQVYLTILLSGKSRVYLAMYFAVWLKMMITFGSSQATDWLFKKNNTAPEWFFVGSGLTSLKMRSSRYIHVHAFMTIIYLYHTHFFCYVFRLTSRKRKSSIWHESKEVFWYPTRIALISTSVVLR